MHGDGSTASAFALDAEGTPRLINTVDCGGTNPVHLAVVDESTLAVANYASGTVAFLAITASGGLGEVKASIELGGSPGPHGEQKGPHPHQVRVSRRGGRLYVPDKGVDTVFEISLERSAPAVVAATATAPGAGPRHLVEHPDLPAAYVVNELASSVTTYRTGDGLAWQQSVPTVQARTPPTSGAAIVISPDGRFLYVSNRGHDSVTRFVIEPRTGLLEPAGWTPCDGHFPRFMTLDPSGSRLLVANERSDSIVPFAIDPASGQLTKSRPSITTGSPVCIAFAPGTEGRLT